MGEGLYLSRHSMVLFENFERTIISSIHQFALAISLLTMQLLRRAYLTVLRHILI